MADINSAAAMAASIPVKAEVLSLPGFGPGPGASAFNPVDFRVRYGKFDLDDMGSVSDLEIIETKGLKGEDVVVLNKDKFAFMDKMFIIVVYLEKIQPV
jgi:hypothetical protein